MKKLLTFCFFVTSIAFYSQVNPSPFNVKLANAGEAIESSAIVYDGSYYSIDYPDGDVPDSIGVCTDVIIRAYRILGIDLQKEIHEDILHNKMAYGIVKSADKNIDHRRVPNLATFFKRHGKVLVISKTPSDYKPGDVICWNLAETGSLNHIGLVVNKKSSDGKRNLVIHNIGAGQNIGDFLFGAKIVGHYSYVGN
jgi:uncharacterized protein YijF (DUF1287 family)